MKKKLRVAISAGLAAVTLSASVAFACVTMSGTSYLDTVNGFAWNGGSIPAGSVIGMHATDVATYKGHGTSGTKINWYMLEDNQGTFCHAGNVAEIGVGGPWNGPDGSSTFDIGSATLPEAGILMTGRLWQGDINLCFGDGGDSAWPVYITVI